MAYVVKYHGNIVAGPFLSNYEAVQAQSKLFRKLGSTSVGLKDFEITNE